MTFQAKPEKVFTSDEAFEEADRAFELAERQGNPVAMLAAITLRATLAGHLVKKMEVLQKRSERDLSDAGLEEALQDAAREAGYVIYPRSLPTPQRPTMNRRLFEQYRPESPLPKRLGGEPPLISVVLHTAIIFWRT